MATCPQCGRQVSDNLFVPVSEARGWQKDIRCTCGHLISYKLPGHDEYIRKQIEEDKKRKEKEARRNTTRERLGKRYAMFLTIIVICIVILVTYNTSQIITNKEKSLWQNILAGLILFPSFLFLSLFPFLLSGYTASYPSGSSESLIKRRRIKAFICRLFGVTYGIATIIIFIIMGLNGGHF